MDILYAKDGQFWAGDRPVLLRGVGLGGWLLPEGYMWRLYEACDRPRRMEAMILSLCGEEYAQRFWRTYFDRFITEADIAWLAGQGFNSVRLAMNARKLFSVGEDGAVRFIPEGIRYVDQCVAWCEKHGLYVFLDMHAAPGGQTGRNIDDSSRDLPELFTDRANQDAMTAMWAMLAERYRDESAVGGYDLMNEPLPRPDGAAYNALLLPLYRRLTAAIRATGDRHIVIWEGLHWATDFSLFDGLESADVADNTALQFHKYWSDPDRESIDGYIRTARRLRAPLWMGESGENDLDWFTTAFPMYERQGVGWCFWCYKKMVTPNSPVTFSEPEGWDLIRAYLDGGQAPDSHTARRIFDGFLACLDRIQYHPEVVRALMRRPPVEIPAWAFDGEDISGGRVPGADFRRTCRASLLFLDGHTGPVPWDNRGGVPKKEEERPFLRLGAGDRVSYRVQGRGPLEVEVRVRPGQAGRLTVQGQDPDRDGVWTAAPDEDGLLWLGCESGQALVRSLSVRPAPGGREK